MGHGLLIPAQVQGCSWSCVDYGLNYGLWKGTHSFISTWQVDELN
jgi:hypothetical protein